MIVPSIDDANLAQRPGANTTPANVAELGVRFAQALRTRERQRDDIEQGQPDRAQAHEANDDTRDGVIDDVTDDDTDPVDTGGSAAAAAAAHTVAPPAAPRADATSGGLTLGAASAPTQVSATARSIDARLALDTAAATPLSKADSVWSVSLPTLGDWTLEANAVDGRWDLRFVNPALSAPPMSAAAAGLPSPTQTTLPDAVTGGFDAHTLAAQAQVLAQRLQADGVAMGRIVVDAPHEGRDAQQSFDGRGERHPAHDQRHPGDPRRPR